MANETSNSLVNLGGLSKPADTLIKKVSSAVGGIFAPYQIKRLAKAEAEAAIIKAEGEVQITELQRRAMHRFVEEEARKQQNMEGIISQAIPHLSANANAEKIDNDWISNFFDKSRIVSDKEMQGLWSRVLAGEASSPGTYSKRTVNFISDLDKSDAALFTKLCGFGWLAGIDVLPLVFDISADIYKKHDVIFSNLSHLESIGLIQFEKLSGLVWRDLPKKIAVSYYGQPLMMEMPKDSDNELQIGHVHLTKVGQELAPICGSRPVEGFFEYVRTKWQAHLPK